MINSARLTWLQQAHQASLQAIELRDTLDNLVQQHGLGLYGHAVTGILDADLQAQSGYDHITKAEIDTWIAAMIGLVTDFGAKNDGNTPLGASLNLIG